MLIQKGNVLLFEENGFAVRDIRVKKERSSRLPLRFPPGREKPAMMRPENT